METILYFRKIINLVSGNKINLIIMSIYLLLISILDILGLTFIGIFISNIFSGNLNEYFIFSLIPIELNSELILITIILLFFFKSVLLFLLNSNIIKFSLDQEFNLRKNLININYKKNFETFFQSTSSEYITLLTNFVNSYSSVLQHLIKLFSEITIILFIIIYLLFIDYFTLFFLILILSSFFLLFNYFFLKKLRLFGLENNKANLSMNQLIKSSILGFREIKFFNVENFFLEKLVSKALIMRHNLFKYRLINTSPRFIIEFVLVLFICLILLFSEKNNGGIINNLDVLGIFLMASVRLVPTFNQIISSISILKFGKNAVEIIHEKLFIKDDLFQQKLNQSHFLTSNFETLEFRNTTFNYLNRDNKVLDNLNFKIKNGDFIGIKGQSGSGKSTFINVFLGFLKPSSGSIILNENKIDDIYYFMLKNANYIPQDIFLYDETILENIVFDLNNFDNKKLQNSLNKSNCNEFINDLPQGLNTKIGENGYSLSGGQKQRLAIARSFYFDKKIIILDESFSSLDMKTESKIINEIVKLKNEITLILVSHKESSLKICDKLYNLSNGNLTKI